MERDKVIELANSAGFDASIFEECAYIYAEDWDRVNCTAEVLKLIALVEKETLERAAKFCESEYGDIGSPIAQDLRALKDKQ